MPNRLASHLPASSMNCLIPPRMDAPICAQSGASSPVTAFKAASNSFFSHAPPALIKLVTPPRIPDPISPQFSFSVSSRPNPNRLDRNLPAPSISCPMPSRIARPTSAQLIFFTASQAVTNRSCSQVPALSRIPTIPVRMDCPSSSQLMLFSFSRIEVPSPVMLLKIFGRFVKMPFTMLIRPSATLPRKDPRELTRLSSDGPISIPLISAIPRFFALSFS